jgi:hypothetical protein
MAKYKQPKNEKHKARKDLKDYTVDKEVEGMVPNASGEVMPDVPRKDDKEVIKDEENMVPKIKDADRVYVTKQMEDGDPKRPANSLKVFSKNQKEDAEELIHTLAKKDGSYMSQIKKLTKEQKEELVRRIVKKQIENFINEAALLEKTDQDGDGDNDFDDVKIARMKASGMSDEEAKEKVNEQEDEEPAEDEGEGQAPLADTPETPAAPEAPAIPADSPGSEEATPEPEGTTGGEETAEPVASEEDPDGDGQPGDNRIDKFIAAVQEKPGALAQMKVVLKVIKKVTASEDPKQSIARLGLLKRAIDSLLAKQGADPKQ